MIETRGLVPAIEAADAMTKAAEVMAAEMRLLLGTREGDKNARRDVSQPEMKLAP